METIKTVVLFFTLSLRKHYSKVKGFIEKRACYLVRNKPEWYEYLKHLCTARAEECTTVASPSFNYFKNMSFFKLMYLFVWT